MRKLFIFICILTLLCPWFAFATDSPTKKALVYSNPAIVFTLADDLKEWPELCTQLEEIEGYVLLEALQIYLDKEYEEVEWRLPIKVKPEHEPIVILLDGGQLESSVNSKGHVVVNFKDLEPGFYYIFFYIKGA